MTKAECEKKQARIDIDGEYYFVPDNRNISLYKTGNRDPVGFFTSYAVMLNRIIYLNSLDAASKEKNVNIKRYIEILQQERERIEKLFDSIKDPA